MSSSISNTFPQAPLTVPKPLARAATQVIDSDGDSDGTKAPAATTTPSPTMPAGTPGATVSLKA